MEGRHVCLAGDRDTKLPTIRSRGTRLIMSATRRGEIERQDKLSRAVELPIWGGSK